MLIIRLQRVGRKNDPSFRLVVIDSKRAAKSGSFLEIVGSYDARQGQPQFKAERIKHWISGGAQVSPTVNNLLVKAKILEGKIVNVIPAKKESAETATPATSTPTTPTPEPETPAADETATPEAVPAETTTDTQ